MSNPGRRGPVPSQSGSRVPPSSLAISTLELNGERLVTISYAIEPTEGGARDPLAQLSPAEREVARLALEGLDNASIANIRGTSVRTTAKQLEGVFRRLGVGSRRELIARFSADATRKTP